MKLHILLVDDEPNIHKFLGEALQKRDYGVITAASAEEAFDRLEEKAFDLVILDVNLPGMDGLTALAKIRALDDPPLVIMITAYGDVKSAIQAMKSGAHDCVAKPFELPEMEQTIAHAAEILSLRRQVDALKQQVSFPHFSAMIGKSPAMQEVFRKIPKIARSSSSTVLIMGESGTGKELAARAIHDLSDRSAAPFVGLNCTAIQETLLESELFGYEKGAFTDAKQSTKGLFEVASGGTIFLDEIGDMSVKLQAKLLRVLQERSVRRLGGQREIPIDVRVTTATHRDLQQEIRAGRFREDLYFRLAVVPLYMPRLRDRGEDVPILAKKFLGEFCQQIGKPGMDLSSEAIKAMMNYPWPGNVRELRNLIERLVILEDVPTLTLRQLPAYIAARANAKSSPAGAASETFRERKTRVVIQFEKEYVANLLNRNKGNVSRSAREAGMERSGFQRLMQRHAIRSEDFRPFPNKN